MMTFLTELRLRMLTPATMRQAWHRYWRLTEQSLDLWRHNPPLTTAPVIQASPNHSWSWTSSQLSRPPSLPATTLWKSLWYANVVYSYFVFLIHTRYINGLYSPKLLTLVDARIIRNVILFKQEISKNGCLSSWLLFFSLIFLLMLLRCRIARRWGWYKLADL